MKRATYLTCLLALVLAHSLAAEGLLQFDRLPPLPAVEDGEPNIGVAGPFAGVHNGALIVAGGANFPMGDPARPTEDGRKSLKTYHNRIYALVRESDGESAKYEYVPQDVRLDRPLAYGVSIPTEGGLICIGGERKTHQVDPQDSSNVETDVHYSKQVFVLRWDADARKVVQSDTLAWPGEIADRYPALPPLPVGTSQMAGALVGNHIYIAAGSTEEGATDNFWRLNLAPYRGKVKDPSGWERLPSWPGPRRVLPVVAAQSDGTRDCFYLFSGRRPRSGKDELFTDAYKFDPFAYENRGEDVKRSRLPVGVELWQAWEKLPPVGVSKKGDEPVCVMAGTAAATGVNHILVFGGASGEIHQQLQELEQQIEVARQAGETARAEDLKRRKLEIWDSHPGFSRDVLAFHTITRTWTRVGQFPDRSPVTTTAAKWGKDIVIPSGEVRPGFRTPDVWKISLRNPARFGGVNFAVLGLYLLLLVGMGLYFSTKIASTDDFFKAGQRIPWWAAGLSIFGTQLSAITFMAIPAKVFATDWRYFMGNMAIVAVAPFVIYLFLPFYRRLNVTTAYEYLEKRFNLPTRLVGSVMFMLFQFGRIGVVLFLPSIALSVVTGINIHVCIIVMGVLSLFYTVLGGMEAVVWTDVLQVVVLLGGAIVSLVLMPLGTPGGWNGMIDIAESADQFRLLDLHIDLTTATFLVMFFGGFGANIISYGTDQNVIQRYLTTSSEDNAARSIWTNALLSIPATVLFFAIGSALYAFYSSNPQALDPALQTNDAIFPHFIVTQLPVGVAGALVAAVFAAAMSSLDSSMNSVSAAFTTDFYHRFRTEPSERSCLIVARAVTVTIGVAGTLFALAMAQWDIKSLWDQFVLYLGMFGGGLGGLFLLAIFTRRTHGMAALAGLVGSGIIVFAVRQTYPLHDWFYPVVGIASCFGIGYLLSLLIPIKGKSTEGLTIYSVAERND